MHVMSYVNSIKTDNSTLAAAYAGGRINCYVRRHYFKDASYLPRFALGEKEGDSLTQNKTKNKITTPSFLGYCLARAPHWTSMRPPEHIQVSSLPDPAPSCPFSPPYLLSPSDIKVSQIKMEVLLWN